MRDKFTRTHARTHTRTHTPGTLLSLTLAVQRLLKVAAAALFLLLCTKASGNV
jgi:multisubunit Na+/H+ antiporter MnhG subunit